MKRTVSTIALAIAATLAACGRSDNRMADTTLNRDLSLAAQARGDTLDSLSAIERAAQPNALGAAAPAAARRTAARTT